MGKVFNKGLDDKDDTKEGILKRLKNIEDKNEKLPNALSTGIMPLELVKMLPMKVIFTITLRTIFVGFTETSGNLRKWHY